MTFVQKKSDFFFGEKKKVPLEQCSGTCCTRWQRLKDAKFEASLDSAVISYFKDKSDAVGLPRSFFNTQRAAFSNAHKGLDKLMLLTPWTTQQ